MSVRGKKNAVATRSANVADDGDDGGINDALSIGTVPHGWTFEQYMQHVTFQDNKRREAEQVTREEEARLAQLAREDEDRRTQLAREEARLIREEEARRAMLAREDEARRVQLAREEAQRERDHQLAIEQLKVNGNAALAAAAAVKPPAVFSVQDASRRLAPFDEKDVELYLTTFEKIAIAEKWPKAQWCSIIQSHLTGKALKAFSKLEVNDLNNYIMLKENILAEYELNAEVYRKRFRNSYKRTADSYTDFAQFVILNFERWIASLGANADFNMLKQVILKEQFFNQVPEDLRLYLLDKNPNNLIDAAKRADEYVALRKQGKKQPVVGKHNSNDETSQYKKKVYEPYENRNYQSTFNKGSNYYNESQGYKPFKDKSHLICHNYSKPGHFKRECPLLKNDNNKQVHFVKSRATDSVSQQITISCEYVCNESVRQEPDPYACTARLNNDKGGCTLITAIRDCGADVSVLLKGVVESEYLKPTGEQVTLQSVNGFTPNIPTYYLQVDCIYVTGKIKVALLSTDIKLRGNAQLLIGNDYGCVLEVPKAAYVGVMTRKQAKAQQEGSETNERNAQESVDSVRINNAVEGQSAIPAEIYQDSTSTTGEINDDVLNDLHNLFEKDQDVHEIKSNKLVALQKQDSTLANLWKDVNISKHYLIHSNGLLVRKHVEYNNVCEQIVLPYVLRSKILNLAHCLPSSGHIGMGKMRKRILKYFFWPGVYTDIREYCRTCETCQKIGKGGSIMKAPMEKPPIIDHPFSRLSIDVAGPLPQTKRGNRFVIAIVDHGTRWAETYPVPNHQATTVVQCLCDFMSHYGIPDEILHDLGSDFTSELFTVILSYFGVKQLKCSVAHPQTNTVVERFNGTFKGMLTAATNQFEGEWDDMLKFIMFSYRELPLSDYGFSPYELVFGRYVKGPLSLLFNDWWEAGENQASPHVLDYMLNLREQVQAAINVVHQKKVDSQEKSKKWYDQKAREVNYEPGEEVLVLCTQPKKPLSLKYEGPYKILRKVSPVDYVINFPNKRKTEKVLHANMIKKYNARKEFVNYLSNDVGLIIENDNELFDEMDDFVNINKRVDLDIIIADKLKHLSTNQQADLKALLSQHTDVISDKPGCCQDFVYKIKLKEGSKPVQQHPYRMSPNQQKWLREEIDQLLRDGLIEPCTSEWSSPAILVPKPDGTHRCVIDYRKVNGMVASENFPMMRVDDLIDKIDMLTSWSSKHRTTVSEWCHCV